MGCCQKALFSVSSDNRSQCHLKFQSCLTTEFAGVCFGWVRTIFLETLPNNMWWYRGCLIFFFLGFWPQDSTNLCNSPAVILGESLGHSNSPPHRALGRYRHTSSSRQIFNIFSWLEPLNYYPDGGNGDFKCFNLFSYNHFLFCEAQQSVLHIRNIFFGFSHCDGWLREFDLCVPHIYNPVEQKVMAGQFHAPSHPWCAKKFKYEWEYTSEIFYS